MILNPNVSEIREAFNSEAVVSQRNPVDMPPLKKILMVGAKTNADGTLTDMDQPYLKHALRKVKALGIPVASDFEVEIVNIDKRFGGEDFLSGVYPADLLISCNIMSPAPADPFLLRRFGARRLLEDFLDTATAQDRSLSIHSLEPNIWYRQARETGARVVFVVGGFTEVNEEDYSGSGFGRAGFGELNPIQDYAILIDHETQMKMLAAAGIEVTIVKSGEPEVHPL